jgi:hypothetical protein
MTATLTPLQEQRIRAWLAAHPTLTAGRGTWEAACSIAAINLALTGQLTDTVPECMSEVAGVWMRTIQDRMPDVLRNSAAYHDLLPLAAGTGRAHEAERLALILDWMWGTVLPAVQPFADAHGFGGAWQTMCAQRTSRAAYAAYTDASGAAAAADAAADAAVSFPAAAAAADAAATAADTSVAGDDAEVPAAAADAACAAAEAAKLAAATYVASAANAADFAADAACAAADAAVWRTFDPVGLLRRLIAVTDPRAMAVPA